MSKKAILFDLDGTLTDSGEGIMNAASLALEHFGIPLPERECMRVFVGPPLRDTLIKFGVPQDKTDEGIHVFRSYYSKKGILENFPYPGISDLLAKLQEAGHKLYVATSKPEVMAIRVLEHFGLSQYFDRICGAELDESRSTKAEVINYLLSQTDHDAQLLMVGDTSFDVIGANAHGIPTIGVSWGYGSVADMEQAGAIAIARTTEELFELLNK